jgi:hypothetical protein
MNQIIHLMLGLLRSGNAHTLSLTVSPLSDEMICHDPFLSLTSRYFHPPPSSFNNTHTCSDWLEDEIIDHFQEVAYHYEEDHDHEEDSLDILGAVMPGNQMMSVDWSSKNNPLGRSVTTRVKNQNTCGACW